MKAATLSALTSMPLGRPVEPEVKITYWVSSPATQTRRSGASPIGSRSRPSASSNSQPARAERSSSGSAQVERRTGRSICPAMSRTRAAGRLASTGTKACPLMRQARNAATVRASFSPSTSTGPRPRVWRMSAEASAPARPQSSA